MKPFDAVVAGVLALVGIRSLVHWLRRPFHPSGPRERMLYVLHLTGRIGWWFGLAAFFLAYAVVDEPQTVGWFILVPIALAGLQLLTGFLLSRGADEEQEPTTAGLAGGNGAGRRSDTRGVDLDGEEPHAGVGP